MSVDNIAAAGDGWVRALNQSIAEAYDAIIFERPPRSFLKPDSVLGLSTLYGGAPTGGDVLDLGCGTGLQLLAAGKQMHGRLVGIDISEESVTRARAHCAQFGDRVDVRCADFLDLDAAALGQFDLIYNVGVLYVTPPQVRARILQLIAQCLKPGGTAVISYYAGTWYVIRASIIRLLRAMDDQEAPLVERIAALKRGIGELRDAVPQHSEQHGLLLAILNQLATTADDVLFHEALNPVFEVIDTPALAAGLERYGLQFLGYMRSGGGETLRSSRERALAAGKRDFASGSYRFAVFSRLAEDVASINVRSPAVRWQSTLRRHETDGDGVIYRGDKVGIRTDSPQTQAVLDALAPQPIGWDDIKRAVMPHLDPADVEVGLLTLERELLKLWQHRFITPMRLTTR